MNTESQDFRARGERSGPAKLNDNAVREIRRLYHDQSCNMAELAARYMVSISTISNVLHLRSWSHVLPVPDQDEIKKDREPNGCAG